MCYLFETGALELRDQPASDSQALGLKVRATIPACTPGTHRGHCSAAVKRHHDHSVQLRKALSWGLPAVSELQSFITMAGSMTAHGRRGPGEATSSSASRSTGSRKREPWVWFVLLKPQRPPSDMLPPTRAHLILQEPVGAVLIQTTIIDMFTKMIDIYV